MAYRNEADRERILHARPELLIFARRADRAYANRDASKAAVAPVELNYEQGKFRREMERRVEERKLVDLRCIARLPGAKLEKIQELRDAEQTYEAAQRARAKREREESDTLCHARYVAGVGEAAADELRRFFGQDPELFDRGSPPRLKPEFAKEPEREQPAPSRPRVDKLAVAWNDARELQAALQREHLERILQSTG
jgi:hypothetical protein